MEKLKCECELRSQLRVSDTLYGTLSAELPEELYEINVGLRSLGGFALKKLRLPSSILLPHGLERGNDQEGEKEIRDPYETLENKHYYWFSWQHYDVRPYRTFSCYVVEDSSFS